METVRVWHDGVQFIAPKDFDFIDRPLALYPTFCGPGIALGDVLVPDKPYGVNLGAACHVHDEMWSRHPKSWTIFHCSNGIFFHNMHAIVEKHKRLVSPEDFEALHKIITAYTLAVSTAGALVYWRD